MLRICRLSLDKRSIWNEGINFMSKELLSFVIPCYRSEKTIASVVAELIDEVGKRGDEYDYEIYLVNDCSPDNVLSVIRRLCEENDRIHGVSFSKNFGQHAALMAGYGFCRGDIIISLDDDGQAPVESIYKLVDKIKEGYDVVFGKYPTVKQSSFRKLGSRLNDKMSEVLLDKPKEIVGNSFYAMRGFIAKEMVNYKNSYPYIGGLIFRATRNIANVDVEQRERIVGKSGYSFMKLIMLWLNGFTSFSVKPLRVASFIGIFSAIAGFILGIYTIVRKFVNPDIMLGYSSLMAIVLFIGGLIMVMLGLIGEYIGRIYISINNSPQYVLKELINFESRKDELYVGKKDL